MTRPLWTLAEIVAASGGRLEAPGLPRDAADGHAGGATAITGVSIDTRSLEPGDLFVPLTDQRDGHAFVPAAFARGAAAALVREGYQRQLGDGLLVRVPDVAGRDCVLAALERIGIAARARLAATARVVAVTGSAGKTGTKEMLRACLRACATSPERVHAPVKSFNNHWGVPLTLARMPAATELAVLEIGMNHAGEISPLTRMVRPEVAIVTNVLPVHVGNFPDGEPGVARAKAEIFEGLPPGGTAIVLRDSPHYATLAAAAEARGATVVTFGRGANCDVRLLAVSAVQNNGCQFVSAQLSDGRRVGFDMGLIGHHLADNALAVVAALSMLGCDVERGVSALASVQSAEGRGARALLSDGGIEILLLDESYNANPASMAAALANLERVDLGGRRIAILGDMLELGSDGPRYHLGLLADAARADLVFCCGPLMRHLFDALPEPKRGAWAPDSSGLVARVLAALGPGDVVMVKGSLGSRMAPIVEAVKNRFAPA